MPDRRTGSGRTENLFPLRAGFAVVIAAGRSGRIEPGGEIAFEGWRWGYEGPEIADLLPEGDARISLVIRDAAAAKVLRAGAAVCFYAPAPRDGRGA